MPRPEVPVDPSAPYADLANALRDLRNSKEITYRQMARITNYGKTVLAEAAEGVRLPSLEVLLAYVTACEGELDETREREWRQRWADARDRGKERP